MNGGLPNRIPKRVPAVGWVLGVGLLAAVVLLVHAIVGWRTVLSPWKEMPTGPLAVSLALVLGSYALRAVRIHRYFAPDTSGSFPRSFRLILLHNLFNNLLPMRSGEASFPILMKTEFAVPFSRSVPGLFYLRAMDLHFLLLLGAVALLSGHGPALWGAVVLLLPLPYLAYILQGRLRAATPGGTNRIEELIRRGLDGLPGTPATFWWTWLWTAVNWGVKLLVFAWILRSFTAVPFGTALLGSVTGEISSVLPIHGVAGAGTYEAGVALGLLPLGVDAETALRGGVNLHLFVLGASLLSGGMALLIPMAGRGRTTPESDKASAPGEPNEDS